MATKGVYRGLRSKTVGFSQNGGFAGQRAESGVLSRKCPKTPIF